MTEKCTESHDEKETLSIDVILPGHDERVTTSLFSHTRDKLLVRDGGRCWVCGRTAEECGAPLEAHHWIIERCLTEMIDFERVKADCVAGHWGPDAQAFDWGSFDPVKDPYAFVDNMLVNGKLLCKHHHTAKDSGIHMMPFPLWLGERYGKEGYDFSTVEIIHHETPHD